jgi:hypothetical protein
MERRLTNTNVGDERPSTNRELQEDELDGVTGGLGDAFRGRYQLQLEESRKLLWGPAPRTAPGAAPFDLSIMRGDATRIALAPANAAIAASRVSA